MMKKLLITFGLIMGVLSMQAQDVILGDIINLNVGIEDPTGAHGENPRSPIEPPQASIDDHTFYLNEVHAGFTLCLVDNSGEEPMVVYQVAIPANVYSVVLPATFIGTYELQLHNGGNYYFYSEIELE